MLSALAWIRSLPSRTKTVLKYLFSAILTAFFLYLAFRGTNFGHLLKELRQARYEWMIAYFSVLMASHLMRAWRWRYLLDPLKRGIGFRNLLSAVMVGYLFNNMLPRAGELARPYTIGKLESISKGSALGTIVVERIMDTMSFLLIVLALPLVYRGPLQESFPWLFEASVTVSLGTCVVMLTMVVLMVRRDWTDSLLRAVTRLFPSSIARTLERLVHSFLDGFLFLRQPRKFLPIALLSVVIWGLYGLMIYLAFFAFDLQALGFSGALVVLGISSIGFAIPTPGGTGSYHAFASQTLIRLFGVEPATALGFATVTHTVGFVGVTLIGLCYFVRDHLAVSEILKGEKIHP